jgi:hypothetical protein
MSLQGKTLKDIPMTDNICTGSFSAVLEILLPNKIMLYQDKYFSANIPQQAINSRKS